MIKRIKKIRGVGRFINVEHTKFCSATLIYGPNCYGKSTLSDIFRSMETQDPEILLNRRSIMRNETPVDQEIRFSFKDDSSEAEQNISCLNQKWDTENFDSYIEIFDSRFIEDNVFTGLTITRANRENLTNLLIGEKSVELGKKIRHWKNKILREKTKDIGELEDLTKRRLGTLDLGISLEDFIAIKKPEDTETAKSRLSKLQEGLKRLTKSILEKNKIIKLGEPTKISLEDPTPTVKVIEEHLEKSFEDINDLAYKQMRKHIKQHFDSHGEDEEGWIEKGVNTYLKQEKNIADSRCPFCSQPLETSVGLIETYKSVFSEEYEGFCKELFDGLDTEQKKLQELIALFREKESLVSNNLARCHRWQEYFTDEEKELVDNIDKLSIKVNQCNSKLICLLKESSDKVENLVEEKRKQPFVSIKEKDSVRAKLSGTYGGLEKTIKEYNEVIELILEGIKALKMRSQDDQLVKERKKLKKKIGTLSVEIKRHELSSDIDKLLLLRGEKDKIEREVKKLQKELKKKNEEFIEQYFQDITDIFNRLGSTDFEIQPIYRRHGGQPVYEPTIKFAGEEITHDRLPFVFSDADRRALAFSIFIAKIKKKSESELKNTIVFLDDPVTSFDDNRISQTLMEVKNLATSCRQLIIAAHHSRFLLNAHEILKSIPDIDSKFIEIKRDGFGSVFSSVNDPKTRLDPYARELEKVERFISGDSSVSASDVRRSLRPILQKELEWRFRRDLKETPFDGLGTLIGILKDKTSINNEIARKLYDFNDVLRDDHHETTLDLEEDTRNLSKDIIEFVFSELTSQMVNENNESNRQ